MRELKFRAYIKQISSFIYFTLDTGRLKWKNKDGSKYGEIDPDWAVKEDLVGQYTGLKDKNRKEIYEGDILLDLSRKYKYLVKWDKQGRWLYAGQLDGGPANDGYWVGANHSDIKIIGSIYENPELIKNKS